MQKIFTITENRFESNYPSHDLHDNLAAWDAFYESGERIDVTIVSKHNVRSVEYSANPIKFKNEREWGDLSNGGYSAYVRPGEVIGLEWDDNKIKIKIKLLYGAV